MICWYIVSYLWGSVMEIASVLWANLAIYVGQNAISAWVVFQSWTRSGTAIQFHWSEVVIVFSHSYSSSLPGHIWSIIGPKLLTYLNLRFYILTLTLYKFLGFITYYAKDYPEIRPEIILSIKMHFQWTLLLRCFKTAVPHFYFPQSPHGRYPEGRFTEAVCTEKWRS